MAKLMIVFHSQQFGHTRTMAEAIADGARSPGVEVELVNTNEMRLDMHRFQDCDAVAFGSPDYYSYVAGGLKVFLDDWYIAKQKDAEGLVGKPMGLFYSHGGGGRVREPLEKLFANVGEKVGETVESKGKPDPDVLEKCRQLGRALAERI